MESGTILAARYRLDRLLGQGSTGEAWQAHDPLLARDVAVKLLWNDSAYEPGLRIRMQRELTAAARLVHPGIVQVYDIAQDAGKLFIVSELLRGQDLATLLKERPEGLPLGQALDFGIQIADALAAAHRQGIVHRDLKPSNVFIEPRGQVKVCDFGLAGLENSSALSSRTGLTAGTPAYMAPEQWQGQPAAAAMDLYALGCVLYEMLTGALPFAGGSLPQLMYRTLAETPEPPHRRNPRLPVSVSDLVMGLLAKDPGDRPVSANTVASTLIRIHGSLQNPGQGTTAPTVNADRPSVDDTGAGGPGYRPPGWGHGDGGRGRGDGGQGQGDDDAPGRRYLLAECPETVQVGRPFSLVARIAEAERSGTVAPLAPFPVSGKGADVRLVLHAPGLRLLGDHQRTVRVPIAGDSSPVMFDLRAKAEGPHQVSLTAWLGGTCLGELLLEITAEYARTPGEHREFRAGLDSEAVEGAVCLVVRYDTERNAYRFEFRDEDYPDEIVSRLTFDPRPRVERLIADLDRLAAGRGGYSAAQVHDFLANAGAELWQELVPAGLREQFWERQHRIRHLTILADRDTVPWELLYPRDPGRDAGFLVQQFPLTRSIFGKRPCSRLSLGPARFVLPQGSLPQATVEIDAMRRLLAPGQAADDVIADLTPLQDLIRRGEFGLLHFACHNRFEPDDDASIRLGSVLFTPRFMTNAVIDKVLEQSAPVVFMNACRSAGLAPTYNRLDGWASKFLRAGAGAFIGSQWAVSDGTAREFAEEFYGQLKTGTSLGEAMMQARSKAAEHADDPTWLAYAAYGDPRATIDRTQAA